MNQAVNPSRLFLASCLALITTAFSFSIRAGILPQLGTEFGLSAEQLGFINSMWFLGFPIAMIVGGLVYNSVGPKIIMNVAFVCHTLGILLTIYAGGYSTLLISTLFIGIGNGCTEAACNPMIADMYSGNTMNAKLNRFHMWFPGGIVVGSLISLAMTTLNLGWQAQIWIILVPTIAYAVLFFGQAFPQPKVEGVTSLGKNFQAMLTPLYLTIFGLMALTAISEFGPQQWTALILSKSGAEPLLILALVTGLMAVGRYFGGPVIQRFDQTGVLLGGAIFASIGIFLFATQTGAMAYVAAVFFAIGVCYFWPTMIGFIAERVPLSGALGMSIVGGVGMFSTAIFQPIIGGWIDAEKIKSAKEYGLKVSSSMSNKQLTDFFAGLAEKAKTNVDLKELLVKIDLESGQATLMKMTTFPLILVAAFAILYIVMRNRRPSYQTEAAVAQQPQL